MGVWNSITTAMRGVISKMFGLQTIEQAVQVKSPLSDIMQTRLFDWRDMYLNKPYWAQKDNQVKSMNLAASVANYYATRITIEMGWHISASSEDGQTQDENGNYLMNERTEYLSGEFARLIPELRQKVEQACAAGGMIIRPYPDENSGRIYFDCNMDWSICPLAFDDDGNLSDVIIPDCFVDGDTYYTRLERHSYDGKDVTIQNMAFKSNSADALGKPISLSEVERWADLEPEAVMPDTGGMLFGWFKVATANNIDPECPFGCSVFAKAEGAIHEADEQYSRLIWEYEGSELAVDSTIEALRPYKDGTLEMPRHFDRLFRSLDVQKGVAGDDLYAVFSPTIRDQSLINGLNQHLIRVEDLCGISRGVLSDPNQVAKTATELRISQQDSYVSIADNQQALERALRDVIRAMDRYCDYYGLAPEGDYEVCFDWDDSIITDSETEEARWQKMVSMGAMSKVEYRMKMMGETLEQAQQALDMVKKEQTVDYDEMLKARDL